MSVDKGRPRGGRSGEGWWGEGWWGEGRAGRGEPSPPALRAGTSPPSQLLSLLPSPQEEAGLMKCGGDMGGLWQWWGYVGEQGESRCHRYPAPWCPHPPAPPQPLSTDVPGSPLSPQQPWHHGVAPRHLETPASAESLHRQAHRDPAPDSVLPLAAWWPPLHPCHFPRIQEMSLRTRARATRQLESHPRCARREAVEGCVCCSSRPARCWQPRLVALCSPSIFSRVGDPQRWSAFRGGWQCWLKPPRFALRFRS